MAPQPNLQLRPGDALLIVDVQRDFLPGGALAVPRGDEVIEPLNRAARLFARHGLPVLASRDWHPVDHVSFAAQGGPWPRHCVRDTPGAEFPAELQLPRDVQVVSKATAPEPDAYSAFSGTDLHARLERLGVRRLFVAGLATEYCVLASVRDASEHGYQVFLLTDAIRGIDPTASRRAMAEMLTRASEVSSADLERANS